MSEINPFKLPPLVEYENCITCEEMVGTIETYVKIYKDIPKWRLLKRWKMRIVISALYGVHEYIHKKPILFGGSNEIK